MFRQSVTRKRFYLLWLYGQSSLPRNALRLSGNGSGGEIVSGKVVNISFRAHLFSFTINNISLRVHLISFWVRLFSGKAINISFWVYLIWFRVYPFSFWVHLSPLRFLNEGEKASGRSFRAANMPGKVCPNSFRDLLASLIGAGRINIRFDKGLADNLKNHKNLKNRTNCTKS